MKHEFVTRILSCLLAVTMIAMFAACGRADIKETQTEERQESSQTAAVPAESSTNDEPVETTDTAQGGSKVLIVYFTVAENSSVDAVSSASYTTINGTAVGRLRAVADMIQENTNGDLFFIQTSVVYPTDGSELIDYAAEEQDANARPELTSHIKDLDQYDTIFVGFPKLYPTNRACI